MYQLILTTLLAFCAAPLAFSILPTSSSPFDIPEEMITTMTWDVQAHPSGPNLTLHGTVQEVHAQLKKLNPNYDNEDWGDSDSDSDSDKDTMSKNLSAHLDHAKRNKYLYCLPYGDEKGAWPRPTTDNIEYLRKRKGQPKLYGNRCASVSCSWRSSIWWCNDDRNTRALPAYNNVADGAQVVVNGCQRNDMEQFGGALDHVDLWRVVVRDGRC
ncbi:hypothetical protein BJX76DRAFT_360612 [Aspergillus varians]